MQSPFESSRLLYRAVEDDDDILLYTIHADYIAVMNTFHGRPMPNSKAIAKAVRERFQKHFLGVVICLCDTPATVGTPTTAGMGDSSKSPTPIGIISLRTGDPIFAHHRDADVGINILAHYRSQGYGREAIEWVLEYGFSLAGLHRIGIGCFSWNDGARKLYSRIGFTEEARNRKALWFKGEWWDRIGFGMLEEEWKEIRARSGI